MKRKVFIHIAFWLGCLAVWSAQDLAYYPYYSKNIVTNLFKLFPYLPFVYINLYFLVPKFLLRKKVNHYLLLSSLGVIFTTFLTSWSLIFFYNYIRKYKGKAVFYSSLEGGLSLLSDVVIIVCLSMILLLIKEWFEKDNYTKEIEKKNMEVELQMLKNQLNPHFLFNALNSIYVMLGRKTEVGKEMLLQFSDLLSHQLYDSPLEFVQLQKEINYLKSYISLETVKHEDIANVKVNFSILDSNLKIAPMLLLPLVENAFKHGQTSKGYWIDIEAKVESDNYLHFIIENSYIKNAASKESKGIGLSNLNKRLRLLYPGKHRILVEKNNDTFKVNLTLKLNEV
ncbi:sensor histidine kinase [Tenacibaculum xiamenense]|uniref:sensor histidine kinase n=1 Tax=Tenacibaculum xiamenense TaxID=1261553 RepID=UPI0038967103